MPVNFKDIKTTRGRGYDVDKVSVLNDSLQSLPIKKRASVLASIIEESGGDPLAKSKGGTYQGLLQWGKDRYSVASDNADEELKRQLQYMRNTFTNTSDQKSWTNGGTGSGYGSWRSAYKQFNDQSLPLDSVFRGFNYGYVRPAGGEDSYNNRLKVASQIYDRLVEYEDNKMGPFPVSDYIDKSPTLNKVLETFKSEGGQLRKRNNWNDLTLKEKSEMMKAAVQQGIYNLSDIRKAYNEFAEGGPTEEDRVLDLSDKGYKSKEDLKITGTPPLVGIGPKVAKIAEKAADLNNEALYTLYNTTENLGKWIVGKMPNKYKAAIGELYSALKQNTVGTRPKEGSDFGARLPAFMQRVVDSVNDEKAYGGPLVDLANRYY